MANQNSNNTISFEIEVIGKSETVKKITDIKLSLKDVTAERKKLNKEYEKGNIVEKQYREQLTKLEAKQKVLRTERNKLNRQLKLEQKQLAVNTGSMAAMRLETNKLAQTVNEFAVGIDGTEDQLKKLKRQLARNRKAIIDWDLALNSGKTNVGRYQQSLLGLGTTFQNLGLIVGAGIGLQSIRSGFIEVINISKDFEFQISKSFSLLVDATDAQKKALRELAIEQGKTTEFTAEQSAQAIEFLAMAGYNANQIMTTLPATLQLASAGSLDLGRAADIASNILSGFRLEASETQRVVDASAYTAANFNTNIEEMGEAMKYLAPISAALNIPLEESNVVVGALANNGIKGGEATRSLTSAFGRLAKPTRKMAAAMKQLNVDFFDAEGNFVGIAGTIEILEQKFEGLTDKQKIANIQTIFGSEATKQITALMGFQKDAIIDNERVTLKGAEALRHFTQETREASGAAKKMSEARLDNLQGDLLKLQSAIEGAAIEFTEAGQGGLRNFVQFLTKAVPVLADNVGLIAKITALLALYIARQKIAGVQTVLTAGAKKAYAIAAGLLTKQVKFSTVAVKGFNAAVRANPLGFALTVITSVSLAMDLFRGRTKSAAEEQKRLADVTQDLSDEYTKEKAKLDALFKPLADDTANRSQKAKAISVLKKQYGKLLEQQGIDLTNTNDLTRAYKLLNDKILDNVIVNAKRIQTEELVNKKAAIQLELTRAERIKAEEKANERRTIFGGRTTSRAFRDARKKAKEAKDELKSINNSIKNLDKDLANVEIDLRKTFENVDLSVLSSSSPTDNNVNDDNGTPNYKATLAEKKRAEEQAKKERGRKAKADKVEQDRKAKEEKSERERLNQQKKAEEERLQAELLRIKNQAQIDEINLLEEGLEREEKLKKEQVRQEIAALEARKIKKKKDQKKLSKDQLDFNAAIDKQIKIKEEQREKDLAAIRKKYQDKELDTKIKTIEETAKKEQQILESTITDTKDLETAKRDLAVETARKKLQLLEAEALASEGITQAQLNQIKAVKDEINKLLSGETPDQFTPEGFVKDLFGLNDENAQLAVDTAAKVSGDIYEFLKNQRDQQIKKELNDTIHLAEQRKEVRLAALEREKEQGLVTEQEYEQRRQVIETQTERQRQFAERRAFDQEKQAQRNRVYIESAVGAIRAVASSLGNPIAIALKLASLAVQTGLSIAAINSQEYPRGERGLFLQKGKRHTQGGEIVELEQGEAVINRKILQSGDVFNLTGTPLQIADALNSYQGFGIDFIKQNKISPISRQVYQNGGIGGRLPVHRTLRIPNSNTNNNVSKEDFAVFADKLIRRIEEQKLVTPVREMTDKQRQLNNSKNGSIWTR